jgi:hypothetical protein
VQEVNVEGREETLSEQLDEVVVGRGDAATLTIGAPAVDADGTYTFPVRLSARALTAEGEIEVEPWSGGPARLIAFLEDLAANWRGWDGEKEWRDDGGEVELVATHDRVGRVTIQAILVSDLWQSDGHWRTEVSLPIEPGTLDSLAAAVRRLTE